MANGADDFIDLDMLTVAKSRTRAGDETNFSHNNAMSADGQYAFIEVKGKGRRKGRIRVDTPEKRRLMQDLIDEMERTAYYERPITSNFKPERPKPEPIDPDAVVPCPKCHAELPDCWFCGGERYLTGRQIRALEEERKEGQE